jgi:hypothetical protein
MEMESTTSSRIKGRVPFFLNEKLLDDDLGAL